MPKLDHVAVAVFDLDAAIAHMSDAELETEIERLNMELAGGDKVDLLHEGDQVDEVDQVAKC